MRSKRKEQVKRAEAYAKAGKPLDAEKAFASKPNRREHGVFMAAEAARYSFKELYERAGRTQPKLSVAGGIEQQKLQRKAREDAVAERKFDARKKTHRYKVQSTKYKV